MDRDHTGTPNPIAPEGASTTNENKADTANKTTVEPVTPTPPIVDPATPPSTPPTEPKKPKALIATTIILAILALAGIGFGVYGMFLKPEPKCEAGCTETTSEADATNTSTTASNSATDKVIPSPVSVTEATELLANKYNFKDSQAVIFDGWHSYIKDFSLPKKLLFTFYQLWDELESPQPVESDGLKVKYNIGFERFKNAYEEYFGTDEPLEKKDYTLNGIVEEIRYNADDNSFDFISKNGIGGTTTVALKTKVIKTEGTENGFKATVVTVTINQVASQNAKDFLGKSSDGQGNEYYNVPISEEELAKMYESLSVYEFNFTKENDSYKLTSITKVQ